MSNLEQFGFSNQPGSVHTKRTIMSGELTSLIDYSGDSKLSHDEYERLIIEDNCLGKRSTSTRKYTATYLTNLYILDFSVPLYRALHYFWFRDESSRSMLAMICAYTRDSILRDSAQYIMNLPVNTSPVKKDFENHMDAKYPDRFSEKMLQSMIRNLLSSWTQSGHLVGRVKKIRQNPEFGVGAVAYALFLSYLSGFRGQTLFNSEYTKLLETPVTKQIKLAEEASRRGWIVFKRVGDVIEVLFPNLITDKELELLREQN